MNRKAHVAWGAATGATVAALRAKDEEPWKALLEATGGALGGAIGGRLPDVLEPAIHPRHRDVAHSATALVVSGSLAYRALQGWEEHCRGRANQFAAVRSTATTDLDRLVALLGEAFWHVAAGVLAGLGGGYASHLVMDSGTSMGIPVISRAIG